MINLDSVTAELDKLSEPNRVALCLLVAERASAILKAQFPKDSNSVERLIDTLWMLASAETSPRGLEEVRTDLEHLVPDSEAEPEAGPSIPAGEALLACCYIMENPTAENAFTCILSAYTAVEMRAFLAASPSISGGSNVFSKAEHEQLVKTAQADADVQRFWEHLTRTVEQLTKGVAPTTLRSA